MKKPPRYLCFGSILVSFLLLNACQDIQPQPLQPDSPSAVENVPTNLLRTTVVDSLITLSGPIDFSSVSRTGHGPSGRLIRWGSIESPGYWRSFTYDPAGRLIGMFQDAYGAQHITELGHYQGAYLAESLVQETFEGESRVSAIKRYQYDTQGHLSQILIYYSSDDKPETFRLYNWVLYEYDAQGQLRKSRRQSVLDSHYDVFYWQKGDCVREERYSIVGSGKPDELQERTDIYFSSQTDPLSELPFYDDYVTQQPSAHYIASAQTYQIWDGVFTPYSGPPGCTIINTFEYDGQGRLSRMRIIAGGGWDYFTYAQ